MKCFDPNCDGTYERREMDGGCTYWYECTECCEELNSQQFDEIARLRLLETGIVKPLEALLKREIGVKIMPRYSDGSWQVLLTDLSDEWVKRVFFVENTLPEALAAAKKSEGSESDE